MMPKATRAVQRFKDACAILAADTQTVSWEGKARASVHHDK